MESRPLWIIGSGGMLGRAIADVIGDGFGVHEQWQAPAIGWNDDDVGTQLDAAVDGFLDAVGVADWTVVWCAGAGVVGTTLPTLEQETASLRRVLDRLRNAPGSGCVFLSSSAGGVHAGSPDRPITESSEPAPLADYGRNKLVQEDLVTQWAASTGHRAAIGRIANLYGPGQSLAKQQGLISQLCLSTLTRRPLSIYVSLDTIRDYITAHDAAKLVLAMVGRLLTEPGGTTVVKLLGSGRSISIGGVLAETRRVIGRRPTVVLAASPNRRFQGTTLMFRSEVWPELDHVAQTTLPAGIAAIAESIRSKLASGAIA